MNNLSRSSTFYYCCFPLSFLIYSIKRKCIQKCNFDTFLKLEFLKGKVTQRLILRYNVRSRYETRWYGCNRWLNEKQEEGLKKMFVRSQIFYIVRNQNDADHKQKRQETENNNNKINISV